MAAPLFAAKEDSSQAAEHLDAVRRLASTLGGETILALDGPLLPKPAWKFVLEVYDPAGFQQEIEWALNQIHLDPSVSSSSMAPMRLQSDATGARTYYTLHLPGDLLEVHYTFVDGYLVATPSRALLDRTIRFYKAGSHIGHSPRLTAALPADGNVNFSALLFQDVSAKLGPMISSFASVGASRLTPEAQAALGRISENTPATLFYAYAEETRITLGHSAPEGALDAATLMSLIGSMGIQDMLSGTSAMNSPEAAPAAPGIEPDGDHEE